MKVSRSQPATSGDAPQVAGDGRQPERVEQLDVRHLARVVWKWRILVVAGVLFIVSATVALFGLTPPDYEAQTTLLFDQPALVATGEQGLATTQKLANLMPTYARVATSDPVLRRVEAELATDQGPEALRQRIDAAPLPDALAIAIRARDEEASIAEQLVVETAQALADVLEDAQIESEIPPQLRITVTPLLEPTAERPERNQARTLVLAGLMGFAVMVGIAFFLEYLENADQAAEESESTE